MPFLIVDMPFDTSTKWSLPTSAAVAMPLPNAIRLLLLMLCSLGPFQGNALGQTAVAQATRVVVDGWSSGAELAPINQADGQVVLQPGQPEIAVFFHAAGVKSDGLFRYRLQGFADGWTQTREHVAHFWKLPPGEYRFEVQAATSTGEWTDSGAALTLQQRPFFYQTWYAGVMVGVFLLAVGAQLLRQRDQLLKGQMGMVLEERNRIAAECHDTLMAGFAAVSWQLEATAKLLETAPQEQLQSANSLEVARSMVSHCQAEARRIIWDLRNSNQITTRLSDALADALDAHRQRDEAKATLDVQGEEVALAPAAVHHLVCIGQEAVTNAMRHARSSAIRVSLHYDLDSLCLSVSDNGCGFPAEGVRSKAGHFGIPVMEERARKLGGVFRISSSAATGTEVVVTVNFNGIHQPAVQQTAVVPWIGL